jgi:Protein of unknown function (DUF2914)
MKKAMWISLTIVLVILGSYMFLTRDTGLSISDELMEIAEKSIRDRNTTEAEVKAETKVEVVKAIPIDTAPTTTTTTITTTTLPVVVGQGLSVTGALGTGVENRTLIEESTQFGAYVGRVYCLITVSGADQPTEVETVWYYKDKEKARTELPIKYKKHRTWSYKTIHPQQVGDWRVDVVDSSGNVLKSLSFVVR